MDLMTTQQTQLVAEPTSSEIATMQAAVVLAKKFPRDEQVARERIKRECERLSLAKNAIYSYPRGGKNVSGPTIRLAEAVAKSWGNLHYGIVELSKNRGQSELEAYAWDLENNTRAVRRFIVNHTRSTKNGNVELTDDRDIYEATANFGSRRVRACLLEVIPSDIIDAAMSVCKDTVINDSSDATPISDRITNMLKAFKKDFKVSQSQIESFCDRPAGNFGKEELFTLQGVYKALKDGMATVEAYFPKEIEEALDISKPVEVKKEGN